MQKEDNKTQQKNKQILDFNENKPSEHTQYVCFETFLKSIANTPLKIITISGHLTVPQQQHQ